MKTFFSLSTLTLMSSTYASYSDWLKQTVVSPNGLIWNENKTLCLKLTNKWIENREKRLAQGKKVRNWDQLSSQRQGRLSAKGISPDCEFTHAEWSDACYEFIEARYPAASSSDVELETAETEFLDQCDGIDDCNKNDFIFEIDDFDSTEKFNIYPAGSLRCEEDSSGIRYRLGFGVGDDYVLTTEPSVFSKIIQHYGSSLLVNSVTCSTGRNTANVWRRPNSNWSLKKIERKCSWVILNSSCPAGYEDNGNFNCLISCPAGSILYPTDGTTCISVGDYQWLLDTRTNVPVSTARVPDSFLLGSYETHPWLIVDPTNQQIIGYFNTFIGNDCNIVLDINSSSSIQMTGSCSGTPPTLEVGGTDIKTYISDNYPVKSGSGSTAYTLTFNKSQMIDAVDLYWLNFQGEPVFYATIYSS